MARKNPAKPSPSDSRFLFRAPTTPRPHSKLPTPSRHPGYASKRTKIEHGASTGFGPVASSMVDNAARPETPGTPSTPGTPINFNKPLPCDKPLPTVPAAQVVNPNSPVIAQRTLIDAAVSGTPTAKDFPALRPDSDGSAATPTLSENDPYSDASTRASKGNASKGAVPKPHSNAFSPQNRRPTFPLTTKSSSIKTEKRPSLPAQSKQVDDGMGAGGSPLTPALSGFKHYGSISFGSPLVHKSRAYGPTAPVHATASPLSMRSSIPIPARGSSVGVTASLSSQAKPATRSGATKWPLLHTNAPNDPTPLTAEPKDHDRGNDFNIHSNWETAEQRFSEGEDTPYSLLPGQESDHASSPLDQSVGSTQEEIPEQELGLGTRVKHADTVILGDLTPLPDVPSLPQKTGKCSGQTVSVETPSPANVSRFPQASALRESENFFTGCTSADASVEAVRTSCGKGSRPGTAQSLEASTDKRSARRITPIRSMQPSRKPTMENTPRHSSTSTSSSRIVSGPYKKRLYPPSSKAGLPQEHVAESVTTHGLNAHDAEGKLDTSRAETLIRKDTTPEASKVDPLSNLRLQFQPQSSTNDLLPDDPAAAANDQQDVISEKDMMTEELATIKSIGKPSKKTFTLPFTYLNKPELMDRLDRQRHAFRARPARPIPPREVAPWEDRPGSEPEVVKQNSRNITNTFFGSRSGGGSMRETAPLYTTSITTEPLHSASTLPSKTARPFGATPRSNSAHHSATNVGDSHHSAISNDSSSGAKDGVTKMKLKKSIRNLFQKRETKTAARPATPASSTKTSAAMAGISFARRFRNANASKPNLPQESVCKSPVVSCEPTASPELRPGNEPTVLVTPARVIQLQAEGSPDPAMTSSVESTPDATKNVSAEVQKMMGIINRLPHDSPERLAGLHIAQASFQIAETSKKAQMDAIKSQKYAADAGLQNQSAELHLGEAERLRKAMDDATQIVVAAQQQIKVHVAAAEQSSEASKNASAKADKHARDAEHRANSIQMLEHRIEELVGAKSDFMETLKELTRDAERSVKN